MNLKALLREPVVNDNQVTLHVSAVTLLTLACLLVGLF
jgi:hypothetical protein